MVMDSVLDTLPGPLPNTGSRSGHNFQKISIHESNVHLGDRYNYHDDPLSRLDFSQNARFNSQYRQHAEICHENTRTELLRDIYNWVDSEDERHIFWLKGWAGTGKSTIAQTVAKHYHDLDRNQLAASFFFARGGGDASHAGLFATSIAVQLASDVPMLRDAVCKAITQYSDITARSLNDQWRRLVLQPFSSLEVTHSPSSYLIVIDALDECNGENNIQTIFQLLSEARQFTPPRLRFLLTSRPDTVIRRSFQKVPMVERRDTVLHEIEPALVGRDITNYLTHELSLIQQDLCLGPNWPMRWQIQQLVHQASGLFIWAATACRYIREGQNHADERLSKVLKTQTGDSAPEKELDAIYTMVLLNSIPESLSDEEKGISYGLLSDILGSVVVSFMPLSIQTLHFLLEISMNEITRTVIDLHSILHIPQEEVGELRLHHPSFRDYLFNPIRCGLESLQISERGAHRRLLLDCLRLMSATLKENICDLDYSNPGILRSDVEERRVQQSIHPALQYACLYWVQHLQKSDEKIYDKDRVDSFMRQHLLVWLEALSWIGRAAESTQAVTCLQSIASTTTCPLFCQYIQDVKRFISYTYPIVERSPLQLYLSALIFTPESSQVRIHFQQKVFRWMKKLPVMEKNWSSLLQTLEGHAKSVKAIAFSPDGTMLASASYDRTVQLWDAATWSVRQTFKGHTDWVNAIAFSPDGTMLASASSDGTVQLWDTATGDARQTVDSHTGWVNVIAFSPDGTMLASVSSNDIVQLWDIATASARRTFKGHTSRVNAIAFSPNGAMLASASSDSTVQLWDTVTGNARQILEGHIDKVNLIAFSPDGTILASGSYDCTVRLWDTATGNVHQTLGGHTGGVNAIAFSPDGTILASASYDCTVQLWDTGTGDTRQTLKSHTHWVNAIAFSPDGTMLASASYDRTVQLWDIMTGKTRQTLKGHTELVNSIAFSPDGTMLASASSDGTVQLWDTATASARQTVDSHTGWVNVIAFSPDGTMLASASSDGTVQLWDTATASARWTFKGHTQGVNAIAFSLDRTMLASASSDSTVQLWDTVTGNARQTLEGHIDKVNSIAFSPDETILASASSDGTVQLWDIATGDARQTLKGHTDWVNAIAFSPDGTILASASYDCTVQLWDTATGNTRQTLKIHTNLVRAIAFSPDGTILASASSDSTVQLWDIMTGKTRQTLKGHTDSVSAIAFSPDGTILASASSDGTVQLWDTVTGNTRQTLKGHTDSVSAIAFSPDGAILITDRGRLQVNSNEVTSYSKPRHLVHAPEVVIKNPWIAFNGYNILWLPPEYRSSVSAVYATKVAIGCPSGQVLLFELDIF